MSRWRLERPAKCSSKSSASSRSTPPQINYFRTRVSSEAGRVAGRRFAWRSPSKCPLKTLVAPLYIHQWTRCVPGSNVVETPKPRSTKAYFFSTLRCSASESAALHSRRVKEREGTDNTTRHSYSFVRVTYGCFMNRHEVERPSPAHRGSSGAIMVPTSGSRASAGVTNVIKDAPNRNVHYAYGRRRETLAVHICGNTHGDAGRSRCSGYSGS